MPANATEQIKKELLSLERILVAALSAESSAGASVVVDNAIGRLTRMEAIQAQAMGQAGRRRQEQRLRQVRAALKRMDDGTYGACTRCGDPIPEGRLAVRPESGLCMTCAQGGSSRA
jgi:RNA polymerase-binding transcription factor